MPKVLTQAQIDQFHEQGFVSPIHVMSDAEALGYRSRLERFEREFLGGSLGGHLRHKTHLLFTWLADLVRHPRILRCGRRPLRPRPPVLDDEFLYQREDQSGLRLLAGVPEGPRPPPTAAVADLRRPDPLWQPRVPPEGWARVAVNAYHEFKADSHRRRGQFRRRDGARRAAHGRPQCSGAHGQRLARQGCAS